MQGTSRLACARQIQSVASEGLAGLRWQLECTQLEFLESARTASSVVVVPTPRTQWGSSRVREISGHQAQPKNTPMKREAAVTILASEGLALVSVSRQHARRSFVPQCTFFAIVSVTTLLLSLPISDFSELMNLLAQILRNIF